jgi:hypothetical protein
MELKENSITEDLIITKAKIDKIKQELEDNQNLHSRLIDTLVNERSIELVGRFVQLNDGRCGIVSGVPNIKYIHINLFCITSNRKIHFQNVKYEYGKIDDLKEITEDEFKELIYNKVINEWINTFEKMED